MNTPSSVNEFFKYSNDWTYEKIVATTHNITWDIFLYLFSKNFIITSKRNGQVCDFGIPFYMTEDRKFWQSFVDGFAHKIHIIDNNTHQRTFNSIPSVNSEYKNLLDILYDYQDIHHESIGRIRSRTNKLFKPSKSNNKAHDRLSALSRIYRENMLYILKTTMNNFN